MTEANNKAKTRKKSSIKITEDNYYFYEKPPEISTLESLQIFLYNEKTGEILGKTGERWGKSVSATKGSLLLKHPVISFMVSLLQHLCSYPVCHNLLGSFVYFIFKIFCSCQKFVEDNAFRRNVQEIYFNYLI